MSELVKNLQKLQSLPHELHLFCPRSGPEDDGYYYDDDLSPELIEAEDANTKSKRLKRLEEVKERKLLVLDCLQILAFDGPDAAPYISWLKERLDGQMIVCDICIREYHRSRSELQHRLEEQFDEEEVGRFIEIFDDMNIARIRNGLTQATSDLLDAAPGDRTIKVLSSEGLYAIFETLSCTPLLRNEVLLADIFDQPFRLVQTKRKLRLSSYTPAMTSFIFGANEFRSQWAFFSWFKARKNLSKTEFDAVIRDPLFEAMKRVQMMNLDINFLPTFWAGVREIVKRLDKDLITHSLRAMDIDIHKLALEHLSVNSPCHADLIGTLQQFLEKSPNDFWDAMGAISPVTVAEQIFNSNYLKEAVARTGNSSDSDTSALDDAFRWVHPFLASIKPSNLTPACRALANQLLNRLQDAQYSQTSKAYCYELGLKVLAQTLRTLNSSRSASTFVGAPTVADILDLVLHHLESILEEIKGPSRHSPISTAGVQGLDVIQQALALDCLSLEVDRDIIKRGDPLQAETKSSTPLWDKIATATSTNRLDLGMKALLGARGLIGLERIFTKPGTAATKEARYFNSRFDAISLSVSNIIEQLSNFAPRDLSKLFETADSASSAMSMLFSSRAEARQAMVELLKVVSSEDGRREALNHVINLSCFNTTTALSTTIRRIARKKIFAPMSSMLKLNADVVDVLCNSQGGILRSRTLSPQESNAIENLWQAFWQALTMIFEMTEAWSNLGYDKQMMIEFCRDTMQFADTLFEECSIFATALKESAANNKEDIELSEVVGRLLRHPTVTMGGMVKWLRLRDEYLASKSVGLTSKLLIRLHEVSAEVAEETLFYVEDVVNGKVRSKLSGQQQAELEKALEVHLGHPISGKVEPVKPAKQGSLSTWVTGAPSRERSRESSAAVSEASADSDAQLSKVLADSSRTADAHKARLEAFRKKHAAPPGPVTQKVAQRNAVDVSEFKRKREMEKEAKKKRDALALAQAKKNVAPKEAPAKGTGMMVSSDESEDDDDPFDRELFGLSKTAKKGAAPRDAKSQIAENLQQLPVKKKKIVRSIRDMRARLAPDLSPLHKAMLSWNYFHDGDFPPNTRTDIYNRVPNTFRAPDEYQNTFTPLLMLEAWQGFVKAREENTFKPFGIKISSRSNVDSFIEIASTMDHTENKEINISEGDIILLSKANTPSASPDAPNCLARVNRIARKKNHLEVTYRVVPGNPLTSSLAPNSTVYGAKIHSITPLEREYGALLGLQYYDLCDEIIKAKPSPLLKYSDKQLTSIVSNYSVNPAQAKAVKSAVDNDAFTLIQGPPGSGKTKTIVAIVGALLSDSFREKGTVIERPGANSFNRNQDAAAPKKLLVCAPSNAAVDELVMRFKDGVKTMAGVHKKINVVRLGRSDAVNTKILDVTLDELVNARLNVGDSSNKGKQQREQTQKIMVEHSEVSAKLREARDKLDNGGAKGDEYNKIKDEFDLLRRRKAQLGTQIDNARDNENTINRQAELNRKRAQQQILDESHVICATLSGSGHEMFQGLNIEFETVVVDEAAQCVEISAIIPLKYGCSKCILVGDPKQLPPTVFSKEAARFQYEQSLFVRMQTNHPKDVHLLDTQYRMHPEISVFPSQTFYDGKLLDGPDMGKIRVRPWHATTLLGPYRFFDVQGQHQAAPKGHSLINLAEIEVALRLFDRVTSDFSSNFVFKGKIGIITPYKSQLRELKDRFSRKFGQSIFDMVDFNTTDAFQGRESEIIIFSCVRASPAGGIGFLEDIRRMNVGLTRAKSSLWVLGNSQSLVRGEYWKKLVEDAKVRDRYTDGNLGSMLSRPLPMRSDAASYFAKENTLPTRDSGAASNGSAVILKKEPVSIKTEDEDVVMDDVASGSEPHSAKTSGRSTPISRPGSHASSGLGKVVEGARAKPSSMPSHSKSDIKREKNRIDDSASKIKSESPMSEVEKKIVPGPAAPNNEAPARPKALAPKRKKEVNPFMPSSKQKKPRAG